MGSWAAFWFLCRPGRETPPTKASRFCGDPGFDSNGRAKPAHFMVQTTFSWPFRPIHLEVLPAAKRLSAALAATATCSSGKTVNGAGDAARPTGFRSIFTLPRRVSPSADGEKNYYLFFLTTCASEKTLLGPASVRQSRACRGPKSPPKRAFRSFGIKPRSAPPQR